MELSGHSLCLSPQVMVFSPTLFRVLGHMNFLPSGICSEKSAVEAQRPPDRSQVVLCGQQWIPSLQQAASGNGQQPYWAFFICNNHGPFPVGEALKFLEKASKANLPRNRWKTLGIPSDLDKGQLCWHCTAVSTEKTMEYKNRSLIE